MILRNLRSLWSQDLRAELKQKQTDKECLFNMNYICTGGKSYDRAFN